MSTRILAEENRLEQKAKAVTIFEVARRAKVAPSTVSLVTNGNGFVSDETREAVEEAIRELGYISRRRRGPSPAATRSLKGLDILVVYVHLPSGPTPMTASTVGVIEGINHTLGLQKIRPSLVAAAGHVADDLVLLSSLESRQVDGAILVGMGMEDRGYAQRLHEAGIPLALVGYQPPRPTVSGVAADYYHGSLLAMRHLLELGHRRIGFAGWNQTHWATVERFRAYQDALEAAGQKNSDPLHTHGVAGDALRDLLKNHLRARLDKGHTAFVMGDSLAKTAVPVLEELGKRVPRDVSVVGFDNLGLTVGKPPLKLTTIGYDQRYLGETAVRTLLDVIESQGRTRSITRTIATEFIPGATTAPCRPRAARQKN